MAPASSIAAEENEMGNPIGMARGILNRNRRTLADAEQREAIHSCGIDHQLQIGDEAFKGNVVNIPVGHPAPTFVVANEPVLL